MIRTYVCCNTETVGVGRCAACSKMASRGKTVEGTDGNDHQFREKVASQYKVSAKLKSNFQFMFHILNIPIVLLSIHVLKLNDIVKFTDQVLPKPEMWEYLYISTAIFNFIGYTSLPRNNVRRLSIYYYGSAATALCSILWATVIHAYEVEAFFMRGRVRAYLFGQPLVIVTYVTLTALTQLNIFSLNYARKLLKAWKAKGYKSN